MKNIIIVILLYYYMFFTRGDISENTKSKIQQNKEPSLTGSPCECRLNMEKLQEIQYNPMYLYAGTNNIIYPTTDTHEVVIQTGEEIEIHCTHPDGLFVGKARTVYPIQSLVLKCLYQWKFACLGKLVDLRYLGCVRRVESKAKVGKLPCGLGGNKIKIGFDLADGRYLHQFSVCFKFSYQIAQWTHSFVTPTVHNWVGCWTKKPRAKFFNLANSTHKCYLPVNVRRVINEQIGRQPDDKWLLDESRHMMLCRGHLVPTADYYYDFQRRATLYYINIVPQWIHFNSIAWNNIETAMRLYGLQRNVQLEVYTGTLHNLKLRHMNNTYVKIYLTNDKKIPVPLYFWKIIYDKKNRAGIAIIGVNNFFMRSKFVPLCNDISPLLPWLTNNTKKYVYACAVDEWVQYVKKIYKDIPTFNVTDLLGLDLQPKNKTINDRTSGK